MPQFKLSNSLLLPELILKKFISKNRYVLILKLEKQRITEYCPKCAQASGSTYDHREIRLKDAPVRHMKVDLIVRKRRLWCATCKKPFTEPLAGVRKGRRTTERYRSSLLWACETFTDLKRVKKTYGCSSDFLYRAYYEQLELKRRMNQYPWPKTIGIDEHSFKRNKTYGHTEFATMLVDYKNKRVMEVVEGKTQAALEHSLAYIGGRKNVQNLILDMCDPYKNFARSFFPNARIVADKFHVLRLLTPMLLKKRREIAGKRGDLRAKKLLLMSSHKLDYKSRFTLKEFLYKHGEIHELYEWKERLHSFYRIKGYHRAAIALRYMLDEMAFSPSKEIKKLRRTLLKWKEEILNYFLTHLTNGRTEGFNNKAKLVKKRAYGYKNFQNYRLRLLHACS